MTAYSCPQESPLESGSREKKRPSVPAAFIQINPTSRFNPTTDPKSFTMLPLKRLTTAIVVTLLIGFALALSKESSSSSAFSRGWIRGRQDAHGDTARSVLAKRDDAPLTNTTAASVASTQVSSQQPTSGTPAASASSAPIESRLSTSQASLSPPASPSSHSASSAASILATSQSPSSAQAVSSASSVSTTSVLAISTTASARSESSSLAVSSGAASSSSKIDKTITTGQVATTSPVAQVITTTLPDGGTLTITSTSWVAVVPTGQASSGSSATEPKLQNAATMGHGPAGFAISLLAISLGVILM